MDTHIKSLDQKFVFNKEDFEHGRSLVMQKLFNNNLPIFDNGDTVINTHISYIVHHRYFNDEDTRCALIYLLCIKYHIIIDQIDLEELLLSMIWTEYYKSRNYKLLQKIYSEKTKDSYIKGFMAFTYTLTKHELWILSVNSWDLNFTKFLYSKILITIKIINADPATLKALTPSDKQYKRFVRLMSKDKNGKIYADYIMHKLDKLSKLKI